VARVAARKVGYQFFLELFVQIFFNAHVLQAGYFQNLNFFPFEMVPTGFVKLFFFSIFYVLDRGIKTKLALQNAKNESLSIRGSG
jgi:hypothetical protein